MTKGKWTYKDEGRHQFGICYDNGSDPRFLWMGVRGEFQIAMARLICRELNRAGIEVAPDKKFNLEVVARKHDKAKKSETAR